MIDGNHRMEMARRLGLETVTAYKVGPELHLQFLTTSQGYSAYLEYWNGKLKDLRGAEKKGQHSGKRIE